MDQNKAEDTTTTTTDTNSTIQPKENGGNASKNPSPTPQPSPSKSGDGVTSRQPAAHAENNNNNNNNTPPPENDEKEKRTSDTTPTQSSSSDVAPLTENNDNLDVPNPDHNKSASTPLLSRPPSATALPPSSNPPPPAPSENDDDKNKDGKNDDKITSNPKSNNTTPDKQVKPITPITPIKGIRASPKPHVIKVTEKKESEENDKTKSKPKPKNIAGEDQTTTDAVDSPKNNNDSSKTNNNNFKESTTTTITTTKQRENTISSINNTSQKHPPESRRFSMIQKQKTFVREMRQEGKTSDIAGDICKMFSVLFAIGVRAVLFGFCMFTVWLVVYRLENDYYYLLALTLILFLLETFNIVIKRAGQERKWFCLCFLCYLICTIPCIWILEIDKLNEFQSTVANVTLNVDVAGVTTNVTLDPNTLLAVTEQCLIFLLILCRWLLPRGDITRDQLSQLLFVYIGMASDVMELFTLFDESSVREDRTLTYIILSVWSLSLLQFTLVLTMSRNPKKIRTAMDHDDETARMKRKRLRDTSFILMLTQSELWSLCISIFMQDGPFLAVRLFTLVTHNLLNYTIVFFTCKNILVILLLLYRVLILLLQKWEDKKKKKDDAADDDDDVDGDDEHHSNDSSSGRHRSKTVSTHLSLSDFEDERRQYTSSSTNNSDMGTKQLNSEGLRPRLSNQVSPA